MKSMDLLQHPVEEGTSLIEASAGTGKTQTIAGLVLRLLLDPVLNGRPLRIDQVLVLTYTEAATEELRDRIRTTIVQALQAFTTGRTDEPLLKGLMARHPERDIVRERLRLSLNCFDLAPIFTIHGFCQRALKDRAFESGSLFDTEVLTDPSVLMQEIADDFWRRRFYEASPLRLAVAAREGLSPASLLPLLLTSINHPRLRIISRSSDDEAVIGARLDQTFATIRQLWLAEGQRVRSHFGSGVSWGNQPYNDDRKMEPLYAALERLCSRPEILARDLAMLNKFCAASLQAAVTRRRTKKTPLAPTDPFFDICGDFVRNSADYAVAVRRAFLNYGRDELRGRKERQKVLTYDDLLTRLHEALRGLGGRSLMDELRRKYKAALIDEFQDTDPVQCEIFATIFQGRPASPAAEDALYLYLIGDPKQAIYGFRGADIFSYLKAKRNATHHFTLGENWRSDSSLVRAVNTIFGHDAQAFVFPGIDFEPVASRGKTDEVPLLLDGRKEPALQIWFCPREPGGGELQRNQINEQLPRAVASEISRLLAGPNKIGNRPLRPQDFAVLVMSHHQAKTVQEALSALNIPSVQHTQESVFATEEAAELLRVLSAIANPSFESGVRAGLATRLAGLSGLALHALQNDDTAWQHYLELHRQAFEEWSLRGFATMFRRWMVEMNVRPRLLASPGGERALTNLLHLGELLHQTALTEKLGPTALTKWLATRIAAHEVAADEYQLRLERDENAVQLVTVHKSKGLQYEIVFAPFSWREADQPRQSNDDPEVFFHDAVDGALVRDLGPEISEDHLQRATTEHLAEYVRLFYVALTRARHRCYVAWGAIKNSDVSAPAWIFHRHRGITAPSQPGTIPAWQLPLSELDDDTLRSDLMERACASTDADGRAAIAVADIPAPAGDLFQPIDESAQALAPRTFTGSIESDWRVTSFSWLTSEQRTRAESPDHDPDEFTRGEDSQGEGIFAFPRGSKAGTCIHKILEDFELQNPDTATLLNCIQKHFTAHGIGNEHAASLADAIHHTLSAPLAAGASFCLNEVPASSRRTELEFCFALNPIDRSVLTRMFSNLELPEWATGWPERVGRLSFSPTRGFLKGFIDLICEVDGRYYLIDWKSNWLGPELKNYHPNAIQREMVSKYYVLQYHLYTVALHRHLELRLPNYDFARHFGGVRYLFLRGINPTAPGHGIFSACPTAEQITLLARTLLAPPGTSLQQ